MADFSAHISQALKNCKILEGLNISVPDSWDWQVTTAFYVSVHLVNAHLAYTAGHHYKSHEKVKDTLFKDGPCKIEETIYLKYVKLEMLSRRSRYLCSEKKGEDNTEAHLTYDRHLKKAILNLDAIMSYMSTLYGLSFNIVNIDCIDLKDATLEFFKYVPKENMAA